MKKRAIKSSVSERQGYDWRGVILLITFWAFLIIILCNSCSNRVLTNTNEVKDSTWVGYKPREIKTFTAAISVDLVKKIECDPITNKPKPFKKEVNKSGAKAKAEIDSTGTLNVTGGCDSLEQVITVLDKEVFRLRHETKKETEVITEYKTRGIDKFCRWFTGIAVLGLIAFAYIKIKTGLV